MSNTYYQRYKLLKDTHLLKAGIELKFHPFSLKYGDEYDTSHSRQLFDLKEMDNTEWFEPIGISKDFFPPAPEDIAEHIDLYPETRHNDMCDFCRAFKRIANTEYLSKQTGELIAKTYEVWREPFTTTKQPLT